MFGKEITHGGKVISASSTIVFNAKKVALIGGVINSPKEGHSINTLIEDSPEWSCDGKAIAVDGCRCEYGCQVISSAPECNRINNGLGSS